MWKLCAGGEPLDAIAEGRRTGGLGLVIGYAIPLTLGRSGGAVPVAIAFGIANLLVVLAIMKILGALPRQSRTPGGSAGAVRRDRIVCCGFDAAPTQHHDCSGLTSAKRFQQAIVIVYKIGVIAQPRIDHRVIVPVSSAAALAASGRQPFSDLPDRLAPRTAMTH
jgi:hypothetical protein